MVAVSESMKSDVHNFYGVPLERIRVIHNGIDTGEYRPVSSPDTLKRYGVSPHEPYILFVGRITRQKGIIHLLEAARYLRPGIQVVLCAGSPDTKEIGREMEEHVEQLRSAGHRVIWVAEMVPKTDIIPLYGHASVFVCPSIYEPFGIINLEAMACGTPVVASAVGGIPEAVADGETGLLVRFEPVSPINPEPKDPGAFAHAIAGAVNGLLDSPGTLHRMGQAARRRVEEHFSWRAIARKTLDFYGELAKKPVFF